MAGKVTSYETSREEVVPKVLHGMKEAKLLIIQCADHLGDTKTYLAVEVEPGDIRTFPEGMWGALGKPSAWLMDQINEQYYNKKAAPPAVKVERTKKAAAPVKMDGAI